MKFTFETPVGNFSNRKDAIEAIRAFDPTHRISQRYPNSFVTVLNQYGETVRFSDDEVAENLLEKQRQYETSISFWEGN